MQRHWKLYPTPRNRTAKSPWQKRCKRRQEMSKQWGCETIIIFGSVAPACDNKFESPQGTEKEITPLCASGAVEGCIRNSLAPSRKENIWTLLGQWLTQVFRRDWQPAHNPLIDELVARSFKHYGVSTAIGRKLANSLSGSHQCTPLMLSCVYYMW